VAGLRRPGADRAGRRGTTRESRPRGGHRARRAGRSSSHHRALADLPQVGYDGSAFRQQASTTTATPLPGTVPNPQTTYSGLLTASWEIDLWGRIRRETEAARARLLASEEARRGVLLTLTSGVVGSYLQLRSLDEQLAVVRRPCAPGKSRCASSRRAAAPAWSPTSSCPGPFGARFGAAANSLARTAGRRSRERLVRPARPESGTRRARPTDRGTRPCRRSLRPAVRPARAPPGRAPG